MPNRYARIGAPRSVPMARYDMPSALGPSLGGAPDEGHFRAWYADMAKLFDLNPDPDDPAQFYDYRAAFRAGAAPDASGHWPSDFKRAGHQNLVVGGFHTQTGERVPGTPRAKTADELVALGWDPATAARLAQMPEPKVTR